MQWRKVTLAGTVTTLVIDTPIHPGLSNLVFDHNGNLYVPTSNAVLKVSPTSANQHVCSRIGGPFNSGRGT